MLLMFHVLFLDLLDLFHAPFLGLELFIHLDRFPVAGNAHDFLDADDNSPKKQDGDGDAEDKGQEFFKVLHVKTIIN